MRNPFKKLDTAGYLRIVRLGLRLIVLGVILLGLIPFTSLSPLSLTAGWAIPWSCFAGIVLLLAFLRARFFCQWLCPVGLALNLTKARLSTHWVPKLPILAFCLGATLAGYSLYGLFEPTAFLLRVDILIGLFLLSLLAPGVWCAKICPLGACQDWLARLQRKPQEAIPSRRAFLTCGIGATVAWALKQKTLPSLRPPMSHSNFLQRCIRCGACVKACPTHIIHLPTGGLLPPYIEFTNSACAPDCIACTRICPTGALQRLTSQEDKRLVRIGLASVNLDTCRQSYGRECGICAMNCPYQALTSEWDGENMRSVLRVDENKCTGCNVCATHCPTTPSSITVQPYTRR